MARGLLGLGGPVPSLWSNGLVVHDSDVRVNVALALGAQVAVWALELRLLAALRAQVVAESSLPAVHLAAGRAREGSGALTRRGVQQGLFVLVVLLLLGVILGVLDQDARAHV